MKDHKETKETTAIELQKWAQEDHKPSTEQSSPKKETKPGNYFKDELQVDYSLVDYSVERKGNLYIPEKYKRPGYVYQFVTDEGNDIESKKKMGFFIIHDEEMQVGDNVASKTHRYGSAVTVPSKCGQTLVLMATSQDNFDKYMNARDLKALDRERALGRLDNIPENHQYYNGASGLQINKGVLPTPNKM